MAHTPVYSTTLPAVAAAWLTKSLVWDISSLPSLTFDLVAADLKLMNWPSNLGRVNTLSSKGCYLNMFVFYLT